MPANSRPVSAAGHVRFLTARPSAGGAPGGPPFRAGEVLFLPVPEREPAPERAWARVTAAPPRAAGMACGEVPAMNRRIAWALVMVTVATAIIARLGELLRAPL